MNANRAMVFACLLAAGLGTVGCGEQAGGGTAATPDWVLTSAPPDAVGVGEAKASVQEGDEVVLRGRIGGRLEPLDPESPVFTLIDVSIPHCGELEGDTCPTPWDYCCEPAESLTANTATVQIVDGEGRAVNSSPAAHGFSELDEVVVVGLVGPRENERVLTVRASGIYRVP